MHTTIRSILTENLDFLVGSTDPAELDAFTVEWAEHGFEERAAEMQAWVNARVFDAATAGGFRSSGLTPAHITAVDPDYGYEVSNGDESMEVAVRKAWATADLEGVDLELELRSVEVQGDAPWWPDGGPDVRWHVRVLDDGDMLVSFAVERVERDEDGDPVVDTDDLWRGLSDLAGEVMQGLGYTLRDSGPQGAHLSGGLAFDGGEYQHWRAPVEARAQRSAEL